MAPIVLRFGRKLCWFSASHPKWATSFLSRFVIWLSKIFPVHQACKVDKRKVYGGEPLPLSNKSNRCIVDVKEQLFMPLHKNLILCLYDNTVWTTSLKAPNYIPHLYCWKRLALVIMYHSLNVGPSHHSQETEHWLFPR